MNSEYNVLMVLANYDFRDEEYVVPRAYFEENGIGTKVAAADPDDCRGVGGTIISPDLTLDQVNVTEFDAILFVGGTGVEQLFNNDLVLSLARDFYKTGKLTCAICWAPIILAHAGLIRDKRVAAWQGSKADLEASGAIFTSEPVTIDGNIITASGPESANEMARVITDFLLQQV